MHLSISSFLLFRAVLVQAQGNAAPTGQPQPPGTPFPASTYPNATDPSAAAGAVSNQTSPPFYPSPWGEGTGNWSAAYDRARAFVSQLTLTEKVNLTTGVGWEGDRCVGNTGSIPRLDFPGFCLQDSPLGVRDTDFNSAFGAGVTAAATWDRRLFYERGVGMGAEHRDKGVDIQLGPVVGPLGRQPEGGRGWEGFSPDPVLSGVAVYHTIQGIQSSNVLACTKHYIANEQEHYRTPGDGLEAISSNIDDRTMHELYLWPFADAVRAGTASIMCSYNQINNSYGCANSYTLNYLLKGELGFQGPVISDWAAQHAGVSTALAGLDMTMPGDQNFDTGNAYFGANLTIAVLNGTVPQYRIDDMAVRIMAAYYYVGRDTIDTEPNFSSWTLDTFGNRFYFSGTGHGVINEHVDVRADHAAGIRETAAKGTVLLKNTGSLPLSAADVQLTGVFGEDSGDNYEGPNGCGDRGCDQGTLAMGWGSGTANFPYLVSPYTAIENEVLSASKSVEGIPNSYALTQIGQLARRVNDVGGAAIVFGNADAGEGYLTIDNNAGDRNNLTLWQNAEAVVSAVASECNNTIVVLHTVGPVLIGSWNENPNITAILWAGIPGEESGNAIADVLYGKVNPSGKLPFTLGRYRGDYGTDVLYQPNNGAAPPQDNFEEGVFIDYRNFDKLNVTPVYEFGYGMSYTTFTYSDIQVAQQDAAPYVPTTGDTDSAPIYSAIDESPAAYVFPPGFTQLEGFIYPFLNSSDLATASKDPLYGINFTFPADAYSTGPQPRQPASGGPGGNPGLYEVLYKISATITNTGSVAGEEVAQLYISLGGADNPKVVLRNFDKQTIQPGQSLVYTFDVTYRDLANWDTAAQDWIINSEEKVVYVGSSSRNLPLSASLGVVSGSGAGSGGGGSGNSTMTTSAVTTAPSSYSTSMSYSNASSYSAPSSYSMPSSYTTSGSQVGTTAPAATKSSTWAQHHWSSTFSTVPCSTKD